MKRFVTYIYSYEDGKKGNNTGFAKIELKGGELRIEIHLRGLYIGRTAMKVFLFREDAGDLVSFETGEMNIMNGNGDAQILMKAGQIGGSPYDFGAMEGLFLLNGDDRIFLSRWTEGPALTVRKDRIRIWELKEAEEPEVSYDKAETHPESIKPAAGPDNLDGGEGKPGMHVPPVKPMNEAGQGKNGEREAEMPVSSTKPEEADYRKRDEMLESELKMDHISAAEIPMRNIFPRYSWKEIWDSLQKKYQVFAPFEDRRILCVKIELKDLRELPKRYWYLGNNSFLLHGFFNYHYLVIGNIENDRWFIGIPGVYQHQERVMAAIFGFPEFIPAAVGEKAGKTEKKSAEQRNPGQDGTADYTLSAASLGEEPVNRFGFWYRFIEE